MNTIKTTIDFLRNETPIIVKEIIARQIKLQPELEQYGIMGIQHSLHDGKYNLEYLFSAIEADSKILFEQYNRWTNRLFSNLKIPKGTLDNFYYCARDIFEERFAQGLLDEDLFFKLIDYLNVGIEALKFEEPATISYFKADNPFKDFLAKYSDFVFAGDRTSATHFIKDLADNNLEVKDIYRYILQPFQLELGNLWHENKISVAQEHYATAVSQVAMSMLYEKIFAIPKKGKSFLGLCVQGELHEFGMRMVCDYMESSGWDTYYLGANMPNAGIIKMIHEKKPNIIALSCTMIFNISQIKNLVAIIKLEKLATPIIVGGYPFNLDNELWKKIGADACCCDFENTYFLAEKLSGDVNYATTT